MKDWLLLLTTKLNTSNVAYWFSKTAFTLYNMKKPYHIHFYIVILISAMSCLDIVQMMVRSIELCSVGLKNCSFVISVINEAEFKSKLTVAFMRKMMESVITSYIQHLGFFKWIFWLIANVVTPGLSKILVFLYSIIKHNILALFYVE